jgi:hypothetical protein
MSSVGVPGPAGQQVSGPAGQRAAALPQVCRATSEDTIRIPQPRVVTRTSPFNVVAPRTSPSNVVAARPRIPGVTTLEFFDRDGGSFNRDAAAPTRPGARSWRGATPGRPGSVPDQQRR